MRTKTQYQLLINDKGDDSSKQNKSGDSGKGDSNPEATPQQKTKLTDRGESFSRSVRENNIATAHERTNTASKVERKNSNRNPISNTAMGNQHEFQASLSMSVGATATPDGANNESSRRKSS